MTEDEDRHADEVNIAFQMGAEWERKRNCAALQKRIEQLEAALRMIEDDQNWDDITSEWLSGEVHPQDIARAALAGGTRK